MTSGPSQGHGRRGKHPPRSSDRGYSSRGGGLAANRPKPSHKVKLSDATLPAGREEFREARSGKNPQLHAGAGKSGRTQLIMAAYAELKAEGSFFVTCAVIAAKLGNIFSAQEVQKVISRQHLQWDMPVPPLGLDKPDK